ncbi:efflux RND transporter periplasmic adaptor subunit [Gulbenkiania mobilis]|uniref:RND family efflux transporter MFP subunit n=1 Tax=Gulbenkiania mobilis TaxID=397457 RepID=A0ABY2CYQ7_GULMO|nr:RND family efflux transporter MFP subunit [Gulbenkiania mobilis]
MRLFTLCALVMVLTACSGKPAGENGTDKGGGRKKGPPPVTVTVAPAAERPLAQTVRAYAEIEARDTPQVAAEVGGRVLSVEVQAGQSVRAGQVLARLDAATLSDTRVAAEAEVARLVALLADQTAKTRRDEALRAQGFVSEAAVTTSRAQQAALEKQLAAAQATAASRRRDTARATVVAPVSGVIETREVQPGDVVSTGRVLFRLQGAGARRARIAVGGSAADRLAPGMTVVLGEDGAQVRTRLEEVRATLDTASRARIAYASLPAGFALAGTTLPAEVRLAERTGLAIPALAVVERPAGRVVYLARGERVEERKVSTGLESDGYVEILAGLKAGERVVVDGAGFLSPSSRIRLVAPPGGKPGRKGASAPQEARA